MFGRYEDVINLELDSEEEMEEGDEEQHEETPAKGRRLLECPIEACGKTYQGGVVQRLVNHVRSAHADEPDLDKYLMEVNGSRPHKTPKVQCNRCGKMIAGRASQMAAHQKSSNCR
jgi:hypothetical protein